MDAGLYKTVPIHEPLRLRGELIAVNALNHPNWNNPSTNISAAGQAGVIGGVGGVSALDPSGPRSMRLGVRLEF